MYTVISIIRDHINPKSLKCSNSDPKRFWGKAHFGAVLGAIEPCIETSYTEAGDSWVVSKLASPFLNPPISTGPILKRTPKGTLT